MYLAVIYRTVRRDRRFGIWTHESSAVWNWRQREPFARETAGGSCRRRRAAGFTGCNSPRSLRRASAPTLETRGVKCKHIFAATFVMRREQNADGSCHGYETATFTVTERTTYPQNWPAYNAAQTNEKRQVPKLCLPICAAAFRSHKRGRWDALPCHCRMQSFSASVQGLFDGFGTALYDRPSRSANERLHLQDCRTTIRSSITLRIPN